MVRVEDIARRALALADCDAGYLLACQWAIHRYEQHATLHRPRHLRRVGELVIPAPITAGTVTITRGSQVVIGDATAQAAWSPSVVGRHFRGRVTWYEIDGYANNKIHLAAAFSEDDIAATAYHVVQRWSTLDSTVQHVGDSFIHARRRIPLDLKTVQELNESAPARQHVGVGPQFAAEMPESADGLRRYEFYPYSDKSEMIYYVFWKGVDELKPTDLLPQRVAGWALIEGVLIDIYRYKASQAARAGQVEMAGYWRNEARAQESKWDRDHLPAMALNDTGIDDTTFILTTVAERWIPGDIKDAHDQVIANWPR